MKKILLIRIAVITQLLFTMFLLQVFYYSMVNAKATFGYTIDGKQIVSVDMGVQEFTYWEE